MLLVELKFVGALKCLCSGSYWLRMQHVERQRLVCSEGERTLRHQGYLGNNVSVLIPISQLLIYVVTLSC